MLAGRNEAASGPTIAQGTGLAGTAEFADPASLSDERRSTILHRFAVPYLPGLTDTGAAKWMAVSIVASRKEVTPRVCWRKIF